jgi:hypothetical protein
MAPTIHHNLQKLGDLADLCLPHTLNHFSTGEKRGLPHRRQYGFGLTTKVPGKTVTLYVRKDLVSKALEMGRRYNKLWALIQKLSKINWEILKLENE